MASVEIKNVRKAYGSFEIMHDVSTTIRDGEFIILVGPSGCGKSTLLRMVAGLEHVTGGQINIGSRVVNNVAAKDRDIAMVFQNYALYPHMKVADNMGFALTMKGVAKSEIATRVKTAAEILDLGSLLNRLPRELSGGQRQRVAMGRAIVRDPQVFLFDEPLSNLDAKLRVAMRSEIKALHQRLRTTIIYVTHDQIEAMTMADRIVVLNKGAIEQVGSPLELYDRPANLFVAGFIGSPAMNLISGELRDGRFVSNRGVSLPVNGKSIRGSTAAVTYGVRPEHMAIAATGMPVRVEQIEPTGSETLVAVVAEGGDIFNCLFRTRVALSPGDTIRIQPDVEAVHLFDGQRGVRIN